MAAAILHIATIIGGPEWYRFFGAGERLASMAAEGHWLPVVLTTTIAGVLFAWGLYAFSGAGLIRRLPFLMWGLTAITAVYGVRGILPFPVMLLVDEYSTPFWVWSSLICCVYAVAYGVGTWRLSRAG